MIWRFVLFGAESKEGICSEASALMDGCAKPKGKAAAARWSLAKLSGKRTCIRTETLERSAYAGTEGVMLSGKKERADS